MRVLSIPTPAIVEIRKHSCSPCPSRLKISNLSYSTLQRIVSNPRALEAYLDCETSAKASSATTVEVDHVQEAIMKPCPASGSKPSTQLSSNRSLDISGGRGDRGTRKRGDGTRLVPKMAAERSVTDGPEKHLRLHSEERCVRSKVARSVMLDMEHEATQVGHCRVDTMAKHLCARVN